MAQHFPTVINSPPRKTGNCNLPDTFAGRTGQSDPTPARKEGRICTTKQLRKENFFMVAYYENESAVDAALGAAKTAEDVRKIAQDLEQRMAPLHWIQKALNVYWAML